MRSRQVTFTVELTDASYERLASLVSFADREIRLTGATPWPHNIHRGQPLNLRIDVETFEGKVKWRRGRVLVMNAHLVPER